jgi:hypothetical protein
LASSGDAREALEIAALLGVREGPGLVLLAGGAASRANPLAELLPGIEVIAAHPALRSATETPGVSRVMMGAALPFLSASLRGVVLEGRAGSAQLDEGIRALAPGCRLVLLGPSEGALERLRTGELNLLMESAGVLVGARK